MSNKTQSQNNVFIDIWNSFQSLPGWIKIWMVLILMPINMVSVFFLDQPLGSWVAFLAISALLFNAPLLIQIRGFSRLMAFPHVIFWTPLVLILLFARPVATGAYASYLWILFVINVISLLFDYTDSWKWFNGDREIFR